MTNDSGTSGKTPTPSTPAAMEREVDAMQSQLTTLRQLQSSARRQTLIVVLVIIALFATFLGATYSRIKANFNDAAVQKAVSERAEDFLPKASQRLTLAAQNAAPTYREVAMARMREAGPEIASAAGKRLEKVPKENAVVMHAELQTTFDNVARRIDPEVRQTFPSLTDERKKAILTEFHGQIDAENEKIKGHVDQIWTNELLKLHQAMSKFDTALAPGQTHDEAEREFLHSLVMYVDFLIMQSPPTDDTGLDVKRVTAPGAATQPAKVSPATQSAAAR